MGGVAQLSVPLGGVGAGPNWDRRLKVRERMKDGDEG